MGKRPRRFAKNADEVEAFSRYGRRVYCYLQRPGMARKAKRRANRRERREGKDQIRSGQW